MKTCISFMILMIGLLAALPFKSLAQAGNPAGQINFIAGSQSTVPLASVQQEGGIPEVSEQPGIEQEASGNFLLDNWGALLIGLLGFIDLIARLTPSEKDNSIVNFLMSLFNTIVPNLKKGGGSFKLLSK